ncbi:hypothetical protein FPQ18DRAFT_385553 [Pyronema domesticum]|nr:hypothetical protein FPQ18DRAFT_385553 [Pyronema domesticum]
MAMARGANAQVGQSPTPEESDEEEYSSGDDSEYQYEASEDEADIEMTAQSSGFFEQSPQKYAELLAAGVANHARQAAKQNVMISADSTTQGRNIKPSMKKTWMTIIRRQGIVSGPKTAPIRPNIKANKVNQSGKNLKIDTKPFVARYKTTSSEMQRRESRGVLELL